MKACAAIALLLAQAMSPCAVAAPFAYVTNQHDDSVSVFDAQSLKPLRTLGGFGAFTGTPPPTPRSPDE